LLFRQLTGDIPEPLFYVVGGVNISSTVIATRDLWSLHFLLRKANGRLQQGVLNIIWGGVYSYVPPRTCARPHFQALGGPQDGTAATLEGRGVRRGLPSGFKVAGRRDRQPQARKSCACAR